MILFIDDEPYFNDSYKEVLESAGYRVIMERNLISSIELFKKKLVEIQLVILDIMMDIPEKLPEGFVINNTNSGLRTGVEVLRLLNEVPNGKKIPKIILTNVAEESFHSEYKNSDVVKGCYKKKEVSLTKLVEIVNELLKKD